MPVRIEKRNGHRRLVIDIPYRKVDGRGARYRRDSSAATLGAARDEELRIRERIARTGSPYEPIEEAPTGYNLTFAQLVTEYRKTYMSTELKVTTRRGYESVLNHHLLPALGSVPLAAIDGRLVADLDTAIAQGAGRRKRRRSRTTRNNIQIVLRSTLRFARERGYLVSVPEDLPRLKKVEQALLEIPSDEDVAAIVAEAAPSQRRAFLLMARAGLRPNEVRALLWRDVTLAGSKSPGFVRVREGITFNEHHSPKTGQREIPLAPSLNAELGSTKKRIREGNVALTANGTRWGDWSLNQAFKRVVKRAGLAECTVYHLRHFAITSWLRAGIPVHVVQRMAGHKHLSTTQGYVHYLKGDLTMAARLIGNILETASEEAAE